MTHEFYDKVLASFNEAKRDQDEINKKESEFFSKYSLDELTRILIQLERSRLNGTPQYDRVKSEMSRRKAWLCKSTPSEF